jgi:subtilisin-like proprotein convertase family protein
MPPACFLDFSRSCLFADGVVRLFDSPPWRRRFLHKEVAMRPQQTEVNPRGGRGRSHLGLRRVIDRKVRRRMALESLEPRTLLAVLPPTTISAPVDISNRVGAEYDPQVSVDPANALDAVVVYNGVIAPPTVTPNPVSYIAGASTTDGGHTWTPFNINVSVIDPTTSNPIRPFSVFMNANVAFDRNGNFYVLQEQLTGTTTATVEVGNPSAAAAGAVVVSKFNFTGASPSLIQNTVVYEWTGSTDAAINPVLAVDSNLASFQDTKDDGTTVTQTDPFSGNVYVAWVSNDTPQAGNPLGNQFNPNRAELYTSSDGGQTFVGPVTVNNAGNVGSERNANISLTVSQGSADGRVPGGQVSLTWADTGTLATASPPLTEVMYNNVSGGVNATFPVTNAGGITDNGVTDFTIPVSITDTRFLSLSDLKVKLDMIHGNLDELTIRLLPPVGSNLPSFTLYSNFSPPANGANMGVVTGANNSIIAAIGTVFDDTAARSIEDINPFTGARGAAGPFIGHFRPDGGSLDGTFGGATSAQLNGNWTLEITDNKVDQGAVQFLVDASVEMTSGNVAGTNVNTALALRNIANPANAPGDLITTAPVIASDSTLGAFSQFQGRLYLAYVDRLDNQRFGAINNPTNNGDIFLLTSDDNGVTWNRPLGFNPTTGAPNPVNDDNGPTDGFTGSNNGLTGGNLEINGRPQFLPQLAVDQSTGTLAVSWLDMRYDASANRSVYELTTSVDGGQTFSKDQYVNLSQTATDGITNQTVTLAPIPDNFTSNAVPTNIALGTGFREGLAIANGHIYPVWPSNQNKASTSGGPDPLVDIFASPSITAAGPRIVASTMGPVGEPGDTLNGTRAANGAPQASAFTVTFDRPVDPATFTVADVQVIYHDTTAANITGGQVPVVDVVPINLGFFGPAQAHGATQFRIDFAPRSNVGTYSYIILPNVKDRIRSVGFTLNPIATTTVAAVAPQVPKGFTDSSTTNSLIPIAGIPAGQVVTDATVNLTIHYPFTGDLRVSLIAPDGTSVVLANQVPSPFTGDGNSQSGFLNVTFDDAAALSVSSPAAGPPYTGSLKPSQPLAGFINHAPNGNWRLQIVDLFPAGGGDLGTLVNWSLTLQTGTVTFNTNTGNFMDQNANANTDELPVAPASGNVWSNDAYAAPDPLNGVMIDPKDPTGKTFMITAPYNQDTLPLIVPGPHILSTSVPNTAPPDVYTAAGSQINVSIPTTGTPLDSRVSVPLNGRLVSGVSVTLSIAAQKDSNLILTLIAPDGTRISLSNQRGGNGSNFTNTTFSDQAGTAISAGTAPFSGSFRPEVPLASLNGKNPQGSWTLEAVNLGTSNVATLLGWSLTLTTANQPAVDNLVLDHTINALDVTFDRNMDPSSFTPSQILQILGPVGTILKPYNYPSNTPAQPIPASVTAPTPLISSFFVNDDGTFKIGQLNVNLNITHPQDSNLTIVLVGPDGTQVTLASGVGGANGANFTGTTFSDQALVPIASGTAPFTGSFQPTQPLAAFAGKPLAGFWKLEIFDSSATSVGTLTNWSLTATPAVTITPNPLGTDPDPSFPNTYRISFPTQQLSGSYVVQFSSGILDQNGEAIDSNLNAGVELLKGTSSTGTSTSTPIAYPSADIPHAIPSQRSVSSVITVPDDFVIQDVSLVLNITYPNDPDLSASLITPAGTVIHLFTNLPATGNHKNFTNTLLNDNAPTPIQNAGSPYFSTTGFKPQESLDGALGGKLSAGTYTLVINNISATNTGTLTGWSLILNKPLLSSGLGEAVADRSSESFRIFTMDPTNPLSSNTWTAVGPASIGAGNTSTTNTPELSSVGRSGRVTGLAVDSSDASGNTVYAAGATGGIWKTTDFLTTSPTGPTWIPLTNFGPTFGINIGGLAVFGRNSDPNQSIVFAATGEGDTGGVYTVGGAGVSSPGVGFLRSMDGGQNWELLDSLDNTLPFAQRDHFFSKNGGTLSYQIVVDPTATASGGVIVYAALSGTNGGIWRSLDSGMHWSNMLAGQATSVVLDYSSGTGVLGGNLQNVFAGIRGVGVFSSTNEGQTWNLMTGGVGDPLTIDLDRPATTPVGVATNLSPNGPNGRIVLAKPTPPPGASAAEILNLQGWLYAAVVTVDGNFAGNPSVGLWMTKDFGQNWVHVSLGNQPPLGGNANGAQQATPTNNINLTEYNLTGGGANTGLSAQGNYDLSLAADPTNPAIVYVGGSQDFGPTGFIRVDTTNIHDAHALVPFSGVGPDGGLLQLNSNASGALVADDPINLPTPQYFSLDPTTGILSAQGPFINLVHDPLQPFLNDASLFARNSNHFTNDGSGATWTPFDIAGTDQHRIITEIDPLTGHARIIIGDDQGIYSAVDNNGVLSTGIGTAPFSNINRNGNIQITQFYYGAIQPSIAAAQLAFDQSQGQVGSPASGGLIYGSAQDDGGPISDPNLLSNGNLSWAGPGGDGGGVAVDQQGKGTQLQYWWPCCGGNTTDIFQVNGVGRSFGLFQHSNAGPTPDPQWPVADVINFAINPLNGKQAIISSAAGRIFRTENQGQFWSDIGDPAPPVGTPALDGTYAGALAFGAPDPNGPSGVGNLDNFLYAGTVAGHIFISQTGGGAPGTGNAWVNVSAGLDGSPVESIITNPLRGSHEAWAVTLNGVYHISDSLAAGATWQNITSNLFNITHTDFNDPTFVENQLRYLTSIQADWRYLIPNSLSQPNGPTHPVLYVGGEGGVYRSMDGGQTWVPFPNGNTNGTPTPPGTGGGLPDSHISDLLASTGNIDPSTGRAVAAPGDPNVLMASTYGTGMYAIRLAPIVLTDPAVLHLDTTLPPPNGSDSGLFNNDGITNITDPVIDGLTEQSGVFGISVTVNIYDLTPLTPGGPLQVPSAANLIGTGTPDAFGHFQVQVAPGHFLPGGVTDGVKTLGIQAVDQSGTAGNVATLSYTLLTVQPATPNAPTLSHTIPAPGGSDSGISNTDNITNVTNPTFNISGVLPTGIVNLYRDNQIVATVTRTVAGPTTITLTDTGPVPDGTHLYKVQVIDLAGNISAFSATTAVTIDTATPARPAVPVLDPADDSGVLGDNITNVNRPRFDSASQAVPNGIIELIDSAGNIIGQANVSAQGTYNVLGRNPLQPVAALADGTYSFRVIDEDVAGNFSPASLPFSITIKTQTPATPTISVVPTDISGPPGSNITNNTQPRLQGRATPGLDVELIDVGGNVPNGLGGTVGSGNIITPLSPPPVVVDSGGNFLLRFPNALPDGTYTVKARVFDVAGNFSDSATLTLKIQTVAPAVNATLQINPADLVGAAALNPNYPTTTFKRQPRFIGTATTPGGSPAANVTMVLIKVDANGNTIAVLATTTTDVHGNFSLSLAQNLNDGNINLAVQSRDIAGNLGSPSATLIVHVVSITGDYNNDGNADLSLYRPTTDQWFVATSRTAANLQSPFGVPGAIPLQGDFDGDGKTDYAEYNPATATWYLQQSQRGFSTITFGETNVDIPVPADYDGDGVSDIAVYRPPTGRWFIIGSATGPQVASMPAGFTPEPGDIPVPADYQGIGKVDLAVYRPSTATWYIAISHGTLPSTLETVNFGWANHDIPIPADFDGNGKADIALYRPESAQWLILQSSMITTQFPNGTPKAFAFGEPGVDIPVPLDYDNSGKADFGVFRPSATPGMPGTWLILQPTAGARVQVFGAGSDIPVAAPLTYRSGGLVSVTTSRSIGFGGGSGDIGLAAVGQGSGSLDFGSKAANFVAPPSTTSNNAASTATTTTGTATPPNSSVNLVTTSAPTLSSSRRHVVQVRHTANHEPHSSAAHGKIHPELVSHALEGLALTTRPRKHSYER